MGGLAFPNLLNQTWDIVSKHLDIRFSSGVATGIGITVSLVALAIIAQKSRNRVQLKEEEQVPLKEKIIVYLKDDFLFSHCAFEVFKDDKIEVLLLKIQEEIRHPKYIQKLPPDHCVRLHPEEYLRLYFAGRRLEFNRIFSDYNIQHDSTIHVLFVRICFACINARNDK